MPSVCREGPILHEVEGPAAHPPRPAAARLPRCACHRENEPHEGWVFR
jgi:hypothetical protein